jgi:hypothetical protein
MCHFSQGGRRSPLAAQAQPIGSIVGGIIQDQLGFSSTSLPVRLSEVPAMADPMCSHIAEVIGEEVTPDGIATF